MRAVSVGLDGLTWPWSTCSLHVDQDGEIDDDHDDDEDDDENDDDDGEDSHD